MDTRMEELPGLQLWAAQVMASRESDFFIGTPEDHQLDRWWVVPRNRLFNLYLHRFNKSDEDRALHDHPWDNESFIIQGEYLEHFQDGSSVARFQGEHITRKAIEAHRVELINGPVISLFRTGPIIREWGFYCPQGWRHWKEFVSQIPGGNHIGRGCE